MVLSVTILVQPDEIGKDGLRLLLKLVALIIRHELK